MTFIDRKTNGQFTGRKKRETHGIRPMRTEMSEMYEVARIDKTLPPAVGRLGCKKMRECIRVLI